MAANIGFQLGHPEVVLPTTSLSTSSFLMRVWQVLQQLLAALGLILLAPLFLCMWLVVRLGSKGPFLFAQARPGLRGELFKIYKVRTMRPGSEKKTALGTTNSSAEVTAPGRVMRALKLDELPQLWNVARGDMGLVGPRPIPTALDTELRSKIPGFEMRYSVRPGLTSIGQICVQDNAVGDALVADWKLRFEGELHYLNHRSVGYDLLMLFMTCVFVGSRFFKKSPEKQASRGAEEIATQAKAKVAVPILDVPIAVGTYDSLIDTLLEWGEAREHRYVGVCNVHSVTSSGWTPGLRDALLSADLNTADGMPLVWMQRLLGNASAQRVYGPTLMLEALKRAVPMGLRIAFYGGHPDRLPVLLERLKEWFPEINVVEAISPPFRDLTPEEDAEFTGRLQEAQAHLIWVGLGCPKQEQWMHQHRSKIPGVMVGVGAAFDFHAGVVAQAPRILQRFGLEWAFRFWQEPRRLFRRYLTTNPVFVFRASGQLLKHWMFRGKRNSGQINFTTVEVSPSK